MRRLQFAFHTYQLSIVIRSKLIKYLPFGFLVTENTCCGTDFPSCSWVSVTETAWIWGSVERCWCFLWHNKFVPVFYISHTKSEWARNSKTEPGYWFSDQSWLLSDVGNKGNLLWSHLQQRHSPAETAVSWQLLHEAYSFCPCLSSCLPQCLICCQLSGKEKAITNILASLILERR